MDSTNNNIKFNITDEQKLLFDISNAYGIDFIVDNGEVKCNIKKINHTIPLKIKDTENNPSEKQIIKIINKNYNMDYDLFDINYDDLLDLKEDGKNQEIYYRFLQDKPGEEIFKLNIKNQKLDKHINLIYDTKNNYLECQRTINASDGYYAIQKTTKYEFEQTFSNIGQDSLVKYPYTKTIKQNGIEKTTTGFVYGFYFNKQKYFAYFDENNKLDTIRPAYLHDEELKEKIAKLPKLEKLQTENPDEYNNILNYFDQQKNPEIKENEKKEDEKDEKKENLNNEKEKDEKKEENEEEEINEEGNEEKEKDENEEEETKMVGGGIINIPNYQYNPNPYEIFANFDIHFVSKDEKIIGYQVGQNTELIKINQQKTISGKTYKWINKDNFDILYIKDGETISSYILDKDLFKLQYKYIMINNDKKINNDSNSETIYITEYDNKQVVNLYFTKYEVQEFSKLLNTNKDDLTYQNVLDTYLPVKKNNIPNEKEYPLGEKYTAFSFPFKGQTYFANFKLEKERQYKFSHFTPNKILTTDNILTIDKILTEKEKKQLEKYIKPYFLHFTPNKILTDKEEQQLNAYIQQFEADEILTKEEKEKFVENIKQFATKITQLPSLHNKLGNVFVSISRLTKDEEVAYEYFREHYTKQQQELETFEEQYLSQQEEKEEENNNEKEKDAKKEEENEEKDENKENTNEEKEENEKQKDENKEEIYEKVKKRKKETSIKTRAELKLINQIVQNRNIKLTSKDKIIKEIDTILEIKQKSNSNNVPQIPPIPSKYLIKLLKEKFASISDKKVYPTLLKPQQELIGILKPLMDELRTETNNEIYQEQANKIVDIIYQQKYQQKSYKISDITKTFDTAFKLLDQTHNIKQQIIELQETINSTKEEDDKQYKILLIAKNVLNILKQNYNISPLKEEDNKEEEKNENNNEESNDINDNEEEEESEEEEKEKKQFKEIIKATLKEKLTIEQLADISIKLQEQSTRERLETISKELQDQLEDYRKKTQTIQQIIEESIEEKLTIKELKEKLYTTAIKKSKNKQLLNIKKIIEEHNKKKELEQFETELKLKDITELSDLLKQIEKNRQNKEKVSQIKQELKNKLSGKQIQELEEILNENKKENNPEYLLIINEVLKGKLQELSIDDLEKKIKTKKQEKLNNQEYFNIITQIIYEKKYEISLIEELKKQTLQDIVQIWSKKTDNKNNQSETTKKIDNKNNQSETTIIKNKIQEKLDTLTQQLIENTIKQQLDTLDQQELIKIFDEQINRINSGIKNQEYLLLIKQKLKEKLSIMDIGQKVENSKIDISNNNANKATNEYLSIIKQKFKEESKLKTMKKTLEEELKIDNIETTNYKALFLNIKQTITNNIIKSKNSEKDDIENYYIKKYAVKEILKEHLSQQELDNLVKDGEKNEKENNNNEYLSIIKQAQIEKQIKLNEIKTLEEDFQFYLGKRSQYLNPTKEKLKGKLQELSIAELEEKFKENKKENNKVYLLIINEVLKGKFQELSMDDLNKELNKLQQQQENEEEEIEELNDKLNKLKQQPENEEEIEDFNYELNNYQSSDELKVVEKLLKQKRKHQETYNEIVSIIGRIKNEKEEENNKNKEEETLNIKELEQELHNKLNIEQDKYLSLIYKIIQKKEEKEKLKELSIEALVEKFKENKKEHLLLIKKLLEEKLKGLSIEKLTKLQNNIEANNRSMISGDLIGSQEEIEEEIKQYDEKQEHEHQETYNEIVSIIERIKKEKEEEEKIKQEELEEKKKEEIKQKEFEEKINSYKNLTITQLEEEWLKHNKIKDLSNENDKNNQEDKIQVIETAIKRKLKTLDNKKLSNEHEFENNKTLLLDMFKKRKYDIEKTTDDYYNKNDYCNENYISSMMEKIKEEKIKQEQMEEKIKQSYEKQRKDYNEYKTIALIQEFKKIKKQQEEKNNLKGLPIEKLIEKFRKNQKENNEVYLFIISEVLKGKLKKLSTEALTKLQNNSKENNRPMMGGGVIVAQEENETNREEGNKENNNENTETNENEEEEKDEIFLIIESIKKEKENEKNKEEEKEDEDKNEEKNNCSLFIINNILKERFKKLSTEDLNKELNKLKQQPENKEEEKDEIFLTIEEIKQEKTKQTKIEKIKQKNKEICEELNNLAIEQLIEKWETINQQTENKEEGNEIRNEEGKINQENNEEITKEEEKLLIENELEIKFKNINIDGLKKLFKTYQILEHKEILPLIAKCLKEKFNEKKATELKDEQIREQFQQRTENDDDNEKILYIIKEIEYENDKNILTDISNKINKTIDSTAYTLSKLKDNKTGLQNLLSINKFLYNEQKEKLDKLKEITLETQYEKWKKNNGEIKFDEIEELLIKYNILILIIEKQIQIHEEEEKKFEENRKIEEEKLKKKNMEIMKELNKYNNIRTLKIEKQSNINNNFNFTTNNQQQNTTNNRNINNNYSTSMNFYNVNNNNRNYNSYYNNPNNRYSMQQKTIYNNFAYNYNNNYGRYGNNSYNNNNAYRNQNLNYNQRSNLHNNSIYSQTGRSIIQHNYNPNYNQTRQNFNYQQNRKFQYNGYDNTYPSIQRRQYNYAQFNNYHQNYNYNLHSNINNTIRSIHNYNPNYKNFHYINIDRINNRYY